MVPSPAGQELQLDPYQHGGGVVIIEGGAEGGAEGQWGGIDSNGGSMTPLEISPADVSTSFVWLRNISAPLGASESIVFSVKDILGRSLGVVSATYAVSLDGVPVDTGACTVDAIDSPTTVSTFLQTGSGTGLTVTGTYLLSAKVLGDFGAIIYNRFVVLIASAFN